MGAYNWIVRKGRTDPLRLTFQNEDGTPQDLDGCVVRLQARTKPAVDDDTPVISLASDGVSPAIELTHSADDVDEFDTIVCTLVDGALRDAEWEEARYEVVVDWPDEVPRTPPVSGFVILMPEFAR